MGSEKNVRKTPSSGRPATGDKRDVAESIVRAAEFCLLTKTPQQITTREIAAHANVRPAMIGYYFGGKEGLIEEIVRRGLNELQDGLKAIREDIRNKPLASPTRAMISMFAAVQNRNPVVGRILIAEMLHADSRARGRFMREWRPAHGNRVLVDLIAELSAAGYYRPGINAEGIAKMIRSVVFFPLLTRPYLALEGESVESFLDDQWIDFVAAVLDSYLLPKP